MRNVKEIDKTDKTVFIIFSCIFVSFEDFRICIVQYVVFITVL